MKVILFLLGFIIGTIIAEYRACDGLYDVDFGVCRDRN